MLIVRERVRVIEEGRDKENEEWRDKGRESARGIKERENKGIEEGRNKGRVSFILSFRNGYGLLDTSCVPSTSSSNTHL